MHGPPRRLRRSPHLLRLTLAVLALSLLAGCATRGGKRVGTFETDLSTGDVAGFVRIDAGRRMFTGMVRNVRVRVAGSQPFVAPINTRIIMRMDPGTHLVRIDALYDTASIDGETLGRAASIEVSVERGQTRRLTYLAPTGASGQGRLEQVD